MIPSLVKPYLTIGLCVVLVGAISYHFLAVDNAYNEGYNKGGKDERVEWVLKVEQLRKELQIRTAEKQAIIDNKDKESEIQSEVLKAKHAEQILELREILEKSKNENSCLVEPISPDLLRVLNKGRK